MENKWSEAHPIDLYDADISYLDTENITMRNKTKDDEYLYNTWLDNPHELCMMAKEEVEKIYKDSCKKAIQEITILNKKRLNLIQEADILIKQLLISYDKDDKQEVEGLLQKITTNKRA